MKEFSLKKPKIILRTKREEKFLHLYNSLFHCHNEKAHKFHESSYKEFNSLEAKKIIFLMIYSIQGYSRIKAAYFQTFF